jgi:hypothetical protein
MTSSGLDDKKLTTDVATAMGQICESSGQTEEAAAWRARVPTGAATMQAR